MTQTFEVGDLVRLNALARSAHPHSRVFDEWVLMTVIGDVDPHEDGTRRVKIYNLVTGRESFTSVTYLEKVDEPE